MRRLLVCSRVSKSRSDSNVFTTLGGRVCCTQCQARSRRTGLQCRAPAIKGKRVCRFHGGLSTGPRTEAGRERCAQVKTIHGRETAAKRKARSQTSARLAMLETIARSLGMITGSKTRGPKPKSSDLVSVELQEIVSLIKR